MSTSRASLDQARDAEQIARTPRRSEARPCRESLAGRLDRAIDVDLIGLRHLGEALLGGGVDGRKALLAVRFHHAAADEQPVAGLDPDVVCALGRRGVVEYLLG